MKIRIRGKIILGFLVTTLFVGVLVGIVSVRKSESDLLDMSKKLVRQTAKSVAEMVEAESLVSLEAGEEETEGYQRNLQILRSFIQEEEITYIYSLKKEGDKISFLVDADPDDPAMIGEEYEPFKEILTAFDGEAAVTEEPIADEWGTYYSCFAPVKDDGGNVIAVIGVDCSTDNVKAEVAGLWKNMLITEAIGLVEAIVLAIFLSYLIAGNVKKIGRKIKNLQENGGNLSQRIEIKSSDETGEIADDINSFLENIDQIVQEIHEGSEKLADSTESIEGRMQANKEGIDNINALLSEMQLTMSDTTENLSGIAEEAENIMGMVGQLSDFALKRAGDSEKIQESAAKSFERSVKSQEDIKKKAYELVKDLEAKIKETEQIKQIEQLTNAIIDISGQTGLLSLNANIEAARAGEHGKGFAVVAQEIGVLAGQSSDTAASITEISTTIQAVVSQLAESSGGYIKLVNETILPEYEFFSDMGKEYQESMADIQQYMMGFSDSMKELSGAITKIKENIDSISAAYEEETAGIAEVSEHIGTIKDAAGNVAEEAAGNKQLSESLKRSVKKFTV